MRNLDLDKYYEAPEPVRRERAYGLNRDTPEPEIVAHLFKLYAEKTKGSPAK